MANLEQLQEQLTEITWLIRDSATSGGNRQERQELRDEQIRLLYEIEQAQIRLKVDRHYGRFS